VLVSILALTLRFAVAAVLALSALAKARDFDAFRQTVDTLMRRPRAATAIAVAVAATEAALSALLAAGVFTTAVAAATLALFLGFSAISLWAVRRGLQVHCSCFGAGDRKLGRDSLATSTLLAAATLGYLALVRSNEPSLALGDVPVAVLLGLAAALAGRWVLAAGDLAGIVRHRRVLERDLAA